MSSRRRETADGPEARGARLAMFGPVGFFLRVDDMRKAVDGVQPATGLGSLNAALWVAGFVAIGAFGRFVVGGPGLLWFLVALGAMAAVEKWWPWTRDRVAASTPRSRST